MQEACEKEHGILPHTHDTQLITAQRMIN